MAKLRTAVGAVVIGAALLTLPALAAPALTALRSGPAIGGVSLADGTPMPAGCLGGHAARGTGLRSC